MVVHQHLIVRAEVGDPITDPVKAAEWLNGLVERIGMKVLSGPHTEYCTQEGNRGITGVVIIETSHCAVHIWDETNPSLVQLDVYTCSKLPLGEVFAHLEQMKPVKVEFKFLDRDKELIEVTCG